jgi:phospholipase C
MRSITVCAIAGLALVGGLLVEPSSAHPAASTPITHVVIIDEENHSFDNLFGFFCTRVHQGRIVRAGVNDRCAGSDVARMPDGTTRAMKETPDYGVVISHNVASQHTAMDGGKMDGFAKIYGCTATSDPPYGCMTSFGAVHGTCGSSGTSTCIPNIIRYAERYAISDRTFELRKSPSWGGHLLLAAATLDGFLGESPNRYAGDPGGPGWGCDGGKSSKWRSGSGLILVPSCIPDAAGNLGPTWASYDGLRAAHVPTIFDRLEAANVSWRTYGGSGGPTGSNSGYSWTMCPSFWQCLGSYQSSHLAPANSIVTDADAGHLPAVSFVTPYTNVSTHEPASVSVGDQWLGKIVGGLMASPEWSSTAIFLTWDDCGCFYDHANPLAYNADWGVRLPMLIISPYARAGYTDTTPASVASPLAFIEHDFNLRPLAPCALLIAGKGCTDDSNAYDYRRAFDYSQTPLAGISPIRTTRSLTENKWLSAHPNAGNDPT